MSRIPNPDAHISLSRPDMPEAGVIMEESWHSLTGHASMNIYAGSVETLPVPGNGIGQCDA